jgi:hypothetical protein
MGLIFSWLGQRRGDFTCLSRNTTMSQVPLPAILALSSAIFFQGSCAKTDNCHSIALASIIHVNGRDSGTAGQLLMIPLSCIASGKCGGHVHSIEPASASGSDTIRVWGDVYNCCDYVVMPALNKVELPFKASQPGTYYLQFAQPGSRFITDTVIIN